MTSESPMDETIGDRLTNDRLIDGQLIKDPLDAERIRAGLHFSIAQRIADFELTDSIDSTNAELSRRITPANGVSVLFAETQSDGRGRRGRTWTSPPGGNLYVSFARCFDRELGELSGLSIAIGVAVANTLHSLSYTATRLKWPNDLVAETNGADGRLRLLKLGGVLVESSLQRDADGTASTRAVVGIGLNVRMPETSAIAIDQPWTDLRTLHPTATLDRNALATQLVTHVIGALGDFNVFGLMPFLGQFADHDALSGQVVELHYGDKLISGIAQGLDHDGALRVRTNTGVQLLRAGEVSVRL